MKNRIAIIFVVLISLGGYAQSEKISPVVNEKSSVSGFYNRVNLGILGGSDVSASFHVVNGYRINEHWSAGFGLGAENFRWNSYVPLFLEGNYSLLSSGSTPFVNVMAGYLLPFRNVGSEKGGFTCGGNLGFDFFISDHFGITTSVGYRFAIISTETNGWDDFLNVQQANRYAIKFGVIFK